VAYDFLPSDEERVERRPQGLLDLAFDPEFLRNLSATQQQYGVVSTAKPPAPPGSFRPDVAINRLKRSSVISPKLLAALTKRGES